MTVHTAGIDHLHIWVEDVEAAIGFYRAAFAAEESFRVGDRLVFVRLGGGEVVGLDGRPEAERSPKHVGLRLADGQELEAAVAAVVGAGGRLLERGEHAPGLNYAYIADPDGNVLEL